MIEYPVIKGNKVILRPITLNDTDLIVKWRNNPEVKQNFVFQERFTQQMHEEWFHAKIETGIVVQYIILNRSDMQPVGSVYFRDIDQELRLAEFGIFIGEDHARNKGFGNETANLFTDFGLKTIGLKEIILRVFSDNLSAIKSYSKAGYHITNKENVIWNGKSRELTFMHHKPLSNVITNTKKISFVIPCYASEHTIEKVIFEINGTMEKLPLYSHEMILINDCSPDQTFEQIKKLAKEDNRIVGINLVKNSGQHAALMAGFHQATGDIIVCLDDDGQTPANEVGKLLEKIEEGYDVAYASYENKQHSGFRNLGSRANSKMTEIMLGKPKELFISSYFATTRLIVDEMLRYEGCYPYVIGLVLRSTKNICNVPVNHREREEGKSGYTLNKLIGLWMNGFTSFSVKPLRLANYFGCLMALIGFILTIIIVIKYFVYHAAPLGWSSTTAILLIATGIILMVLGMMGEYIGRIYMCINATPQYIVREIVKAEPDEE